MTKKASGKKPAAKTKRATVRCSTKQVETPIARHPGLTVNRTELNRLLALKHRDPHRLLGAHESNGGVIFRAFRPNATKVEVLIERKKPQPLVKTHEAGLFETVVPDLSGIPSYRFR